MHAYRHAAEYCMYKETQDASINKVGLSHGTWYHRNISFLMLWSALGIFWISSYLPGNKLCQQKKKKKKMEQVEEDMLCVLGVGVVLQIF